jgi:hypothetical protein
MELVRLSVEEFKAAIREEAEARRMDLDQLLDQAGRNLPDKLPTEPRKLTGAELDAAVDWVMNG